MATTAVLKVAAASEQTHTSTMVTTHMQHTVCCPNPLLVIREWYYRKCYVCSYGPMGHIQCPLTRMYKDLAMFI